MDCLCSPIRHTTQNEKFSLGKATRIGTLGKTDVDDRKITSVIDDKNIELNDTTVSFMKEKYLVFMFNNENIHIYKKLYGFATICPSKR